MEGGQLVMMCVEAACRSRESVRAWRKQRRTLEKLPTQLADLLLHRLLFNNLLSAPLLELFQFTVGELDLSGNLSLDAEWLAYIGGFRQLRVLNLTGCKSLNNSAIWHLSGLEWVEELHIDRCKKITDDGLRHILALTTLKRLGLSETGIGHKVLGKLSLLTNLTHLNLGGLPVTDEHMSSFQVLRHLVHLELWGSNISNKGAKMLTSFTKLERLSLAWTAVSILPPMSNLLYLDLSNCENFSILEGCCFTSLQQLYMSKTGILSVSSINEVRILDLSSTTLTMFGFLPSLRKVTSLNLSSTKVSDDTMNLLSECARNLKMIDLSDTKVGSQGIGALCGFAPLLEDILLRRTSVDDKVFSLLATITSLVNIDLGQNDLTGFDTETNTWTVLALQQLPNLRTLDLRKTKFSDKSCKRLASLTQLTHLLLFAEFLSDKSLHELSALTNLQSLSFQGCVLTDSGLGSFRPPSQLKELDLTDCWLVTRECILQFSDRFKHIHVMHDLTELGDLEKKKVTPVKNLRRFIPLNNHSKDERIRYTRTELLNMKEDASTELPLQLASALFEILKTMVI